MQSSRSDINSVNYLTRIAREDANRRQFERRDCHINAGVMYSNKGVRGLVIGKAKLLNVSEGGAFLHVNTPDIPQHFVLYFGEFQYHIACVTIILKEKGRGVSFLKEQPTEFIDILSRISDPNEFIGRIRPTIYGLPELPTIPQKYVSQK
ncbi:PilZ domain-containing protein [Hoeflea ulvae]|uniref:PilZ domain-containing protein n=1 Tax=Hoeflea ulvae TaxID=2983764 RepID=A0ABT3YEH3_9HYPH|nr:PilZ domain-containing protein [Hoeflea ulvae]MCY0094266.1 PilZ domain-containing protein [Hoeflea ulvae]